MINKTNAGKILLLTASELGYYADFFGDDEDDLVKMAELKQKRDLDFQVEVLNRREARKKRLELNQFAFEERKKWRDSAEEEAKQKEAEEAKQKEAKQKEAGAGQQPPTGSTDELLTDLNGSHGSQV